MNYLKTSLLLTITAMILLSCKKDEIHGTGHTITQDRSLPDFENVLIQGPIKANIRYGTSQHVSVRTDAAAISKVSTSVTNNTLVLDLDESYNYQHITFTVDVYMPEIDRLTHEGVSNSTLSGFNAVDLLEVVHNGVGDLDLHGSASHLSVSHDGVGELNAFGFTTGTCQVGHSGVGNIEVTVEDQLHGSLTGVGNIYYRGTPQLDITDTGVGSVVHVD